MKITACLVDDEANNIETLGLLLAHINDIEVIGSYTSPEVAYLDILRNPPDILFLDVEMPGMNGLDLLKRLPELHTAVVFVTAHNDYAVQAFKVNAVDYILKPVLFSELHEAIEKVRKRLAANAVKNVKNILTDERLPLPTASGVEFVPVHEIIRLHGSGSYTEFHLENQRKILVSGNIGEFEKTLEERGFFRCHTSHIINPAHLLRFLKEDGGTLVMNDQAQVPVSRRRKDDFFNLFKS